MHLFFSFRLRPSVKQFPIIVSQDCNHQQTSNIIDSYGKNVTHLRQPDQSNYPHITNKKEKRFIGYYKIARHYKWALSQIFDERGYSVAIIVEGEKLILLV